MEMESSVLSSVSLSAAVPSTRHPIRTKMRILAASPSSAVLPISLFRPPSLSANRGGILLEYTLSHGSMTGFQRQVGGSLRGRYRKHPHYGRGRVGKDMGTDRFKATATARPLDDDQGSSSSSSSAVASVLETPLFGWVDAFYRFSRPHTVIGTALGIISVSLLAVQSMADLSSTFCIGVLQALVPALCMNIYIVGLNQVYDIEIDKINKPYLPLASGEYSLHFGIAMVVFFAVMSLGIGAMIGSRPLLWALSVSFLLGTAYSMKLPFLRWKQSAVAAASCILSVRAIVVQIAFYLHIQTFTFGRPAVLTRPLLFATGFMCFFSIVIALFKDIPDVEGDRIFGIHSFSVRLGQKKVFWLCIILLHAAYAAAITMGITSQEPWSKAVMVIGHAALASILWHRAKQLDLKSKSAITAFYMFVWKLFYAEYLLIPLMR